jgi:DnaJ-class molecular chaperone
LSDLLRNVYVIVRIGLFIIDSNTDKFQYRGHKFMLYIFVNQAVLGSKIDVMTLDGMIELKVNHPKCI